MPAVPLHQKLKEKREDTKGSASPLTQEDVAQILGQSQGQVSKIERGMLDFYKLSGEYLYRVLLAYRCHHSEVMRIAADYELPKLRAYAEERARRRSVREGPRVKHFGLVNAGMVTAAGAVGDVEMVNVPDEIAQRYELDDVFAVDVTGDSMVGDNARNTIPENSRVFFHANLTPEPGEIVCVYLVDHDHSVIKRYEPGRDYTVLRSFNDKHEPIVLPADGDGVLQGVYLAHEVFSRRVR